MVASIDADPRTILFADEAVARTAAPVGLGVPLGFYWTEGRSGIGLTADAIPPLKVGSTIGIPSAPAVLFPDGEVLMPSLRACERLQGFPPGWTDVPHPGRRNSEWRMLGNAASVPVAKWVADRIKSPQSARDFVTFPLTEGKKWPDAAFNVGDGRKGSVASDKPISIAPLSIAAFRDETWSRLSDRALDGSFSVWTGGSAFLKAS